jgi:hypothetical protein
MKNQKQLETVLYSTAGVAIIRGHRRRLNLIFARVSTRVDLTCRQGLHPVRGHQARSCRSSIPRCRSGSTSVRVPAISIPACGPTRSGSRICSAEYRLHSKGKIEIKKLDPKPDSDAEDSATLDGVEGQMAQMGATRSTSGLAVSCLDAKAAIPFIAPQRERLLEYDLTRAVSQVMKPTKPNLGIMSGLPVFGEMRSDDDDAGVAAAGRSPGSSSAS